MQFYQNCILVAVVTVLADGSDKAAKLFDGCDGVGTLFFSLFLFGGGPYEGEPQNAAIEKALDCQLLNPWATNEPTY